MHGKSAQREDISSYCPLCTSRCGALATLEDGRFTELRPDPSHPTGQALCIKGKMAPELVYHPDRLTRPLKRTRPKGDPDPGWVPISWEDAFAIAAEKLNAIAAASGPEAVVFGTASPSTSATVDAQPWMKRLQHAFGSPNFLISMELCGWGRYLASYYSYGAGLPGDYMPDIEHAGTLLFWGYNPTVSRIAHATAAAAALKRGAKLIAVDPRNAGLARKADHWLRIRPGSDGALALGLAQVLIAEGWYDAGFLRDWSDAPFLVRQDNGRLLRASDLDPAGDGDHRLAWDEAAGRAIAYDPATRRFDGNAESLALFGDFTVDGREGPIPCRPVFQLVADLCAAYPPARIEELCGIAAADVVAAAHTIRHNRPLAFHSWSGIEQQSNATQISLAIGLLYALTGDLDREGGNTLFPKVPQNDVAAGDLLTPAQRAKTLGLAGRPLGPGRWEHVTSDELYRAIEAQQPYAVRGLVAFGANLLLAHADGVRGRAALAGLDFYLHADLFMTPTAQLADIVLPVTSAFEAEGLKIGFDFSAEAQSLVQLRKALVQPRGEARSDTQIIFGLAQALGLGGHFWDGDIEAAQNHRLAPGGLTLADLRTEPAGRRLPLQSRFRKFAECDASGRPRGLATPSGKLELYVEAFLDEGHNPLPDYQEPLVSPHSRPDLTARFPFVLTCAKDSLSCESQMRGLPGLRSRAPDPIVELHPETAAAKGIAAGDWVRIETPVSAVRARAKMNDSLDPQVVCGQHGWWQACEEIGAPAYDALKAEGANYNLLIDHKAVDPISGSAPLRAYLCNIARVDEGPLETTAIKRAV
jgi:anaerobic selenocysteine-containing dehydrogenase